MDGDSTEHHMHWRGPIAAFLLDESPEIDLEGGLSSGKTTACLVKVWRSCQAHPGIHWWIGRYGDGETQTKVRPAWEQVCLARGGVPAWNAKELCYEFSAIDGKVSKVFCYGLKSPDLTSRYSKMRGMGVAGIYLDQAEELPEDFSLELRLRLRQSGYPHQLIFSPNPMNVTHWLALQFPEDNHLPSRRYYSISLMDNAHNLPGALITSALLAYPVEHAKHRSVILGKRGLNVTGTPVYRGMFRRDLHVGTVPFQPHQPLLVGVDYGKHHPCVVIAQQPYAGGLHLLGGILGVDLYLDDFLPIVQQQLAQWWPTVAGVQVCCDPAGSRENSMGTRFTGVDILRRFGWEPSWRDNANSPDVRLGAIEAISAHMRRRTGSGEAFLVEADPEKWLRVSLDGRVCDPFLADALEAGYVWDVHMVSVGNKQIRKPKKDGWFEHGMNTMEYLELTFGANQPTREADAKKQAERDRRRLMTPSQHTPRGPRAWAG